METFMMGYGAGSGGAGGGKDLGMKGFAIAILAAGLGVAYLVLKDPDPPGSWCLPTDKLKGDVTQGVKLANMQRRQAAVRGWGDRR